MAGVAINQGYRYLLVGEKIPLSIIAQWCFCDTHMQGNREGKSCGEKICTRRSRQIHPHKLCCTMLFLRHPYAGLRRERRLLPCGADALRWLAPVPVVDSA